MKNYTITAKITCNKCKRFVGFETSDGKKPFMDNCLDKFADSECPMIKSGIQDNAPVYPAPSCKGGGCAWPDEDAGSYQAIARRAMEDGAD